MLTPADRLRSLVKEATPAEDWIFGLPPSYSGSDVHRMVPDGKLAALAPQLAELVADMADGLAHIQSVEKRRSPSNHGFPFAIADELLQRSAALFPEDSA